MKHSKYQPVFGCLGIYWSVTPLAGPLAGCGLALFPLSPLLTYRRRDLKLISRLEARQPKDLIE